MTREKLLGAINNYQPKSLATLRAILQAEGVKFEDQELRELVKQLSLEGELGMVKTPNEGSVRFLEFLRDTSRSWWFYSILLVSLVETVLVFTNLQSPILLLFRMIFGVLLLGFAPGYSTTRAVFPSENFPFLERLMLSIFLSLVISSGLGTVLGAFLIFTAVSSTLLIGLSTISIALVGAYRGLHGGQTGINRA